MSPLEIPLFLIISIVLSSAFFPYGVSEPKRKCPAPNAWACESTIIIVFLSFYSPNRISYRACPPETFMICPVSSLARLLAKNRIVSEISSGWISCPIGMSGTTCFSNSESIHPVCVGPSVTQFTVIPYWAASRATLRVSASRVTTS